MGSNNQTENHILDTILRQLIQSDDVYNPVSEFLKQLGIIPNAEELNRYLNKLQKSKYIEERFDVSPDGRKKPFDPRQHKITPKGSDFIKNNSFTKLGRDKEKRRKKENNLLKLKIFKNWFWILISVPAVLFTLNTIIFEIFDIDIFHHIVAFIKNLISQ